MKKPSAEVLTIYDASSAKRIDALVLICDLEGFTKFCTEPQVEQYIPAFINKVFTLLSRTLVVDDSFDEVRLRFTLAGALPIHTKFLGDGLLAIWEMPKSKADRVAAFMKLLNSLSIVRNGYKDLFDECSEEFGIDSLPAGIRFGIASGEVIRLQVIRSAKTEYVGFPINLASRLQCYCRKLGLVASARIGVGDSLLERDNYKMVKAKALSGMGNELVVVDENDFMSLDKAERRKLFADV